MNGLTLAQVPHNLKLSYDPDIWLLAFFALPLLLLGIGLLAGAVVLVKKGYGKWVALAALAPVALLTLSRVQVPSHQAPPWQDEATHSVHEFTWSDFGPLSQSNHESSGAFSIHYGGDSLMVGVLGLSVVLIVALAALLFFVSACRRHGACNVFKMMTVPVVLAVAAIAAWKWAQESRVHTPQDLRNIVAQELRDELIGLGDELSAMGHSLQGELRTASEEVRDDLFGNGHGPHSHGAPTGAEGEGKHIAGAQAPEPPQPPDPLEGMAKPKIDLSEPAAEAPEGELEGEPEGDPAEGAEGAPEATTEGVPTEADLPGDRPSLAGDGPLPAWVTDPPASDEQVWRRVLSSDPNFTESSRSEALQELVYVKVPAALNDYFRQQAIGPPGSLRSYLPPDEAFAHSSGPELARRVIKKQHLEQRDTSVGEAQVIHLLIEVDRDTADWLRSTVSNWQQERRVANRSSRAGRVAAMGGLVLVGLSLLQALLSWGEKRDAA